VTNGLTALDPAPALLDIDLFSEAVEKEIKGG
jgi:hypothetical protein